MIRIYYGTHANISGVFGVTIISKNQDRLKFQNGCVFLS